MKTILPSTWRVPEQFQARLGESAGRQRAMAAEGHLLLVLHEPPQPADSERTGRLFWREPDGTWKSNSLGTGAQALRSHLQDFADRVDKLEDQLEESAGADDCFRVLRAVAPLHRSARNLHAALQQARELVPADHDLVVFRDRAGEIERACELLNGDAKNALECTMAKQAEEQAKSSYQMAIAAHRLNLLAAVFFPIAALSSIFSMTLHHGLESWPTPVTFWTVLGIGLAIGVVLCAVIARKPARPPGSLGRPKSAGKRPAR